MGVHDLLQELKSQKHSWQNTLDQEGIILDRAKVELRDAQCVLTNLRARHRREEKEAQSKIAAAKRSIGAAERERTRARKKLKELETAITRHPQYARRYGKRHPLSIFNKEE